jgi:probable F420-dependent oxidoreductase
MVSLSVGLSNFAAPPPGGWRGLLDLARAADGAGIDRLVVVDHVVMGRDTSAYRWGEFRFPPGAPWLEPMTTLAALAGVTERIRLATGVVLAPLRGPALLAKTAATLDVLCNGRLDLGVAAGWQAIEYQAQGLDFARRSDLLDATLDACAALWASSPATLRTEAGELEVWCEPRPDRAGGIPVWIAGSLHRRNVERIARHGSGWIPIMGATLDDVREGVRRLHGALADADRVPTELQVRMPLPVVRDEEGRADLDASLRAVPQLIDAGATDVQVSPAVFEPVQAALPRFYEQLRRDFDRAVAGG